MAQLSRYLLLVILSSLLFISCMTEPAFARRSRSRAHIEAACRATRYPVLCVQYLSNYTNGTVQSPEQLAQIALSVSLYRAVQTRAYMLKVAKELEAASKMAEYYKAVKDCLAQISDSVNQLSQSIRELRRLSCEPEPAGDDFFWHISNVETWVSAALTDASFCLDELPGGNNGKLKATIKEKVLNVAQATSNALALFHRYAAKYTEVGVTKKP